MKAMAGAVLLTLTGCAPGQAVAGAAPHGETKMEKKLFAEGVQRFTFRDWAGPAMPVWTYRSPDTPADAPVLFVFHGALRDADNYVDQWLDLARRYRIVLIVPEFSKKAFPGARSYSHGWFTEKDGTPRPADKWSFAVVEPIFAAVKAREGLTAATYSLYGHSGGAQFVHRFILAGGGPHMARAVTANAGSYAMTDPAVAWPFGLAGLPQGLWQPAKVFALPVTVLLGTDDTDPNHHSLPRQPQAMAQGPYRLARGQAFYARARALAAADKLPFAWGCGLVPHVGHDNAGMAPAAIAILFGSDRPVPGADCAAVPSER
ncbi:hypothetical protein [Sphingopyxis panaciterrulae]|uniref:Poly(3-hydroxybutyrate) depolymerase n=1 Tax=Sphingopyxis panaciterrulae TaxID=462372 RepID=A0A7W9EQF1_9SPHN|nr:poly(3-hydroxybutyrate) depolymerase [Sphingopyxis panaciterrulae]